MDAAIFNTQPVSADGPIADYLSDLHFRISRLGGGNVASYIPELAKADPNLCGIAIATTDGKIYAVGDADHAFTIQSVSKPFVYGYALARYGRETVLQRVGVEPTGEAFNSIVLDDKHNRPFNPMVNAGAIAVAETIRGKSDDERVANMLDLFSRLAGRQLDIDEAVFRSERDTGHRNRAIAYMMLNTGMIRRPPEEILDIYFRQCAVKVTCVDLAVMGATLANKGINPLTGQRALPEEYIPDILTVMNSCGMYNYAGQWSYEVGIPAKSGVAGSIMAAIPGQIGIAVFSPPIDEHGNSVRGVAACREIAHDFGLHVFKTSVSTSTVIRRELDGASVRSKRLRSPVERQILDEHGARNRIVEVQGPLYFGSAERLIRRARELAAEGAQVVLDLRRVPSIDETAAKLLARLIDAGEAGPPAILLAYLPPDGPLARLRAELEAGETDLSGAIFATRDEALEWCENLIIAQQGRSPDMTRFSLSGIAIFRNLSAEDLKRLEAAARPLMFEAGATIIREGDAARVFFAIARGTVAVQLAGATEGGRPIRVAMMGPGLTFGEMALFDGGKRSADVVALERVVCYGFAIETLHEIGREHPHILTTIYANVVRDFSERLRRANDEIRALEY
ncbi:glutaminase [Kaistia hirudinis]|uniref:Glutaminase n=1 Tax=Kaistia hirudinis TaxID=1293440 RepID=A0A840ATB0_9HYPH|nr:glutaminase A [Kaistia hirudinis]MBB3933499.1 glutaminase [Kaistia hirudinis]